MKVFALSILGLALAVPAARAQNRDTSMNDTSKTTAQPSTDTSKSTAQPSTDASKSTAESSDTSKAMPMDKSAKDRPAAARSRDLGKDDDCMCDCNGKMIKGKKGHPMGRNPAGMDRSRPSSASDASRANAPASPNAPPADKSAGPSTDTSSQPSKGTGEMNPSTSDKADNPSNPR